MRPYGWSTYIPSSLLCDPSVLDPTSGPDSPSEILVWGRRGWLWAVVRRANSHFHVSWVLTTTCDTPVTKSGRRLTLAGGKIGPVRRTCNK